MPVKIDHAVLKEAYLRAIPFADRQLSKFKHSRMATMVSGMDMVNTAIQKTLDQTRPWNQEITPDLFVHLAGVIRSEISNIFSSVDFKTTDQHTSLDDLLEIYPDSNIPTPDAELERQQKLVETGKLVKSIILYVSKRHNNLTQMLDLMLVDGISKPQELANRLGVSVQEVNTMKLQLSRVVKKFKSSA